MVVSCTGFETSTRLAAESEGLPDVRLVEYPPPNISAQAAVEVHEYAKTLLDEIVRELTKTVAGGEVAVVKSSKVYPRKIVFRGDLDGVNDFFHRNRWTDGLPIIPPTIEAVEAMLKYTNRAADEVIGILKPGNCQATVWKIAVNGVLAGCRPEYMPVLLAVIEAVADPKFGLELAGSTGGWTPLIILNGPIIKELDFNYGLGVFRPERQANITVSRFLRLCMINIAQYRLGISDMATFGRNYIPVLAEAEDESPWQPFSADRGVKPGSNVITVLSCGDMGWHFTSVGTAEEHLQALAEEAARVLAGSAANLMSRFDEVHPVICLTPLIASILAKAGYSKSDIGRYLYENARIPAHQIDSWYPRIVPGLTLCKLVKAGKLPLDFCKTEDPNRLVPVVHNPQEFFIIVTGHALRNRACVIAQVAHQGLPVSKKIELPANWKELLHTRKSSASHRTK